jgi:hypothetical protein
MIRQLGMLGQDVVLGDLEAQIIAAYRHDPEVANSDRLLVLAIWESQGLVEVLGDRLESFRRWFTERASSPETISRAGRKLRSQGLIKASPEVAEARKRLEQAHRNYWRGR